LERGQDQINEAFDVLRTPRHRNKSINQAKWLKITKKSGLKNNLRSMVGNLPAMARLGSEVGGAASGAQQMSLAEMRVRAVSNTSMEFSNKPGPRGAAVDPANADNSRRLS